MFTNTKITIYNKYVNTTTRKLGYHRTVLDSVHYEGIMARSKNSQGTENNDTVKISIPFTVSGGTYVKPKAFALLSDKTGYFTLAEDDTIVKGEVTDDFEDLESTYDDVTVITSVDTADYGSEWMWHWELNCK